MSPPARLPAGAPVIVGAGLAGLLTALAAAPRPVILVSETPPPGGGASALAQGGIAAATGPGDDPARHLADTLAVGDGLNDRQAAARLIACGPEVIATLEAWGVRFDRTAEGDFARGREAGHSIARIHHVADRTGEAVMAALTRRLAMASHITPLFGFRALSLHVREGRIGGIWLARPDGAGLFYHPAAAVVLATGGACGLYGARSAPDCATGSALALAARAGARLRDPEFVQFHPTALDVPARPLPLLTEALRGAGAVVVDERGTAFTDPLAPRDRLARAIADHRAAGHRVLLDARPLGARLARDFPGFLGTIAAHGFDPAHPVVPVRPAAHYHMGGVFTDAAGRTDISGLLVVGEAAASGLHGANRLASNSLLEAAAMGLWAGAALRESLPPLPHTSPPPPPSPRALPCANEELARLMDETMGIRRDAAGLEAALSRLLPAIGGDDRALAAFLMTVAAWSRRESRGAHARIDHPERAPCPRPSLFTLREALATAADAASPSSLRDVFPPETEFVR